MKNILPKIIFIIIMLGLAYSLLTINSEFFLVLFNSWEGMEKTLWQTIILSTPFSLGTLFIMLFFRSKNKLWTYLIRIIFPLLDGFIVMVFFNINIQDFKPLMAVSYGIFTFLIFFFVSETGKSLWRSSKVLPTENKDLENTFQDLARLKGEVERLEKDNLSLKEENNKDIKIEYQQFLILGLQKRLSMYKMQEKRGTQVIYDIDFIELAKKLNYEIN